MTGSFLQSSIWERFQQATGKRTVRADGTLLIEGTTPLGSYWYAPRPVLTAASVDVLRNAAAGAMFVRVDPGSMPDDVDRWQLVPAEPTQPQDSLILTLQPPDQLLATFHEKTRYNIRLAERKGVTVTESSAPDSKELAAFLALSTGTSERQDFHYHDDQYYRALIATLGQPNEEQITASVLTAWQGETSPTGGQAPLAALIAIWTPETAIYLHGASSYEHRALMGPHLVQFTAMQRALAQGCRRYDFWGIAPDDAPQTHPWAGVTRFKLGFGGERVHYPDSCAIVLKPMQYRLYTLLRRIRRGV